MTKAKATKPERVQSLLAALAPDKVIPPGLMRRLGAAFVRQYRPDADPTQMSDEDVAELLLAQVRAYVLNIVEAAEAQAAAAAAREAAIADVLLIDLSDTP